ncbi:MULTISPECIES: MFS transporter [Cohnella]|uniref:MFS transporter n=1 Tax=Cohnella TaxID=329857 RepID=UPI001FE189F8|nr:MULTISPECIES: MFS transporter [Cohnella]
MRLRAWKARLRGTGAIGQDDLKPEAYITLFIHGCFQFGASMSGLFLNLYLWRLTEDLWINGMFNMIVYGITPLAFAAGGYIAKKKDRMVTYRLGIMLIALFYLCVIFAREQVAAYYPVFALFNGIALGLYWTGYIVLMYDVTSERNRGRFLALNLIVFNSAGLAGPALSGLLIGRFEGLQGYIVTFAVAFAMFALASAFSLKIGALKPRHRAYYLKYAGGMMKRNRLWLKSLFGYFVLGLFQGIMLFLPNILLYQTYGREDWVGLLTVLFALITIGTAFTVSRRKSHDRVRSDVFWSSLFVAAASCVLLIDVAWWTVLVFMVVFSIFNPLTINSLNVYYYRLMDVLPLKGQFRIESVVIRELFLNIGRVLSIYALIVFADRPDSAALPVVLVAASLLQFAIVGLVGGKGGSFRPAAGADNEALKG